MKKTLNLLLIAAFCLLAAVSANAQTWHDFEFNTVASSIIADSERQEQWGNIPSFGIAVAEDGTISRVSADDESAVAVFTGFRWHGTQYGVVPGTIVVKAPGNLKITRECVGFGSDISIKSSDGEIKIPYNNDRIAYGYYVGGAGDVTITGGSYILSYKFEKVDVVINEYNYAFGKGDADGVAPTSGKLTEGNNFTIPVNRSLYIEGKTLAGWTDGTATYSFGDIITPTADMNLVPVFADNVKDFADRTAPVTIVWDFQQKNGAPSVGFQGNKGLWVAQAEIDGELIDVKLDIDATHGKLNNAAWTDWAQINGGTVLTIPAAKNMVISLESMGNTTTTTIAGDVINQGTNKPTYTYTGNESTVDIVIGDGSYWRTVTVVYPAAPTSEDVTISSAGWASYAPVMDVTVPEGVEAYYVSAQDGNRAILSPIAAGTAVKANEGILLKGEAGTVTFEKAVSAEAISGNLLSGTQVSLPVSDVTGQVYVLGLESTSGEVGLWQYTGETLAAGKAYLALPVASKGFTFAFGSDEATGVETVSAATANGIGAAYNLAGQQVGAGYKGIVVKDGKKVMVK